MIEFFNHRSALTAEPQMAKVDKKYFTLSEILDESKVHQIYITLLGNNRSREVINKMKAAGTTGEFKIVRQFIACNWDSLDSIPDIDDNNQLHFEYTQCNSKGANRRCPYSTPLDPKPYCIVKTILNIPNHAYSSGNKHLSRRAG